MATPYQESDPACSMPWMPLGIQSVLATQHLYAIGLLITQWSYTSNACAICDIQHWGTPNYKRHDSHIVPFMGTGDRALLGVLKAIFKLRFAGPGIADFEKIL